MWPATRWWTSHWATDKWSPRLLPTCRRWRSPITCWHPLTTLVQYWFQFISSVDFNALNKLSLLWDESSRHSVDEVKSIRQIWIKIYRILKIKYLYVKTSLWTFFYKKRSYNSALIMFTVAVDDILFKKKVVADCKMLDVIFFTYNNCYRG